MKTFKDKILDIKNRFDHFESKSTTLYNSINNKLEDSIVAYNNRLDQIYADIAQDNYKKIIRTLIKIDKRKPKQKQGEKKNG